MRLAREGHGLAPIAGLTDDLNIGLGFQNHPEAGAHELLVVGDHDSDGHARAPVKTHGRCMTRRSPVPGSDSTSIVPWQSATRSRIAIVGQSSRTVFEAVTASVMSSAPNRREISIGVGGPTTVPSASARRR